MPKGKLTCVCSRDKSVLAVTVEGARVGRLCGRCARHIPTLRLFLQAAGWLHGWRSLGFVVLPPGRAMAGQLEAVIRQERERWELLCADQVEDSVRRAVDGAVLLRSP